MAWGCASTPSAKTCKMGNTKDCLYQGERLYENHSQAKSLKYFQRACDAGDGHGCFWAGYIFIEGKGVKADVARGTALYKRACTLKSVGACRRLARMYRKKKRFDESIGYYQKTCDYGSADGCFYHAELVRTEHGHKRASQIKASHQRGCKLGYNPSCEALKKDTMTYSRYERYLHRYCQKDFAYACYLLAQRTERRWYKKACRLRHPLSCQQLGTKVPTKVPNRARASKETFASSLNARRPAIQFCYEHVLWFQNEKATGKIVVLIGVLSTGENTVKIKEIPKSLQPMTPCIVQTLKLIAFPIVEDEFWAKKAFVFSSIGSASKEHKPPR